MVLRVKKGTEREGGGRWKREEEEGGVGVLKGCTFVVDLFSTPAETKMKYMCEETKR